MPDCKESQKLHVSADERYFENLLDTFLWLLEDEWKILSAGRLATEARKSITDLALFFVVHHFVISNYGTNFKPA